MNGETKPRIHLVKKVSKTPAISIQVEDEVEVMDDSEDELVVNRSSNCKRDYSRGNENLFKMNSEDLEDDTEEELSLLYEDEDGAEDVKPTQNELKELNGDHGVEDSTKNEVSNGIENKQVEEITETAKDSEKNNDKQPNSQQESEPEQANRRRRSIKVVQSLEEPKAEVKDEMQPPKEDSENANVEVDNIASRRSKSAEKDDTPAVEPSKVNDDIKSAESETDEEDKPIASKRRKSNSKASQEEDEVSSEDNRPLASRRRKSVVKTLSPKKDAANPRRRSKRSLSPKKYNDSSESTNTTDDEVEQLNGNHEEMEVEEIAVKEEQTADVDNVELDEKSDIKEEPIESDRLSLAESLMEDEDQDEEVDQDAIPSTFSLGDLAWSRVGSHPYWPSVICYDPDSDKFTEVKNTKRKGLTRVYHVQFYGRVQRAWVSQPQMLKFEGVEAFQDLSHQVTNKSMKAAFFPKGSQKAHWKDAVDDCLKVVGKTNEERVEISRLRAETPTLHNRKRRRESCDSSEPVAAKPPVKKAKLENAERLIEAIPEEVLNDNRRKLKTGFKLFQLAHRQSLLSQNDENDVEKVLSKMWKTVSNAEQKFFQEKAAAFMKDSNSDNNKLDEHSDKTEVEKSSLNGDTSSDTTSIQTELETSANSSKSAAAGKSRRSNNGNFTPKRESLMIGQFKRESCCIICEELSQETNDLVKCKGPCQNSFHIKCLHEKGEIPEEQIQDPLVWRCSQCTTGKFKCLICKDDDGTVLKCDQLKCGRYFHEACLKMHGLWPQARISGGKLMQCPAHICHTCASDNPKDPYMKYNAKLFKCIRCPTAYHANDHCVTAGTVQITATQIVCPKHYTPPENKKKKASTFVHTNTTWCFICSKGGSLICCEQCPASFHAECLKIETPEGNYYCDNCETGRMPLYGEVLWVKLGVFRWWPARVLHPTEVPANIEKLAHDVGEFPIQFCGSHDYYWINRGRCFLYDEGDVERIPAMTTNSGKDATYKRGLVEAAEAFNEYTEERNKREKEFALKNQKNNGYSKPPLFNKIKSNRPFGDCPVYSLDPMDMQVCDCDPKSEAPCGPDADCINRILMTECRPSTCKAGDKCLNQRFQRRVYPNLKVVRTRERGWGLFCMQDVKKGDFLIEYVGEMITIDEFKRRIQRSIDNKEEQNYYYMTMDNNRMLDAGPRGNIARFVNHSCDPNSETQKWTVNGDTRIGLFAIEDMPAGTELSFNYQFEAMGEVKKACLCGAKNCSGFIGKKVQKLKKEKADKSNGTPSNPNGAGRKKLKLKKKEKEEEKVIKVWEDLCFRCFDDGEVLMCDWKTCPKVYHLACLGRDKMPREKWHCPWHHCVECGKPAVSHCIHCPNAYCKAHGKSLTEHQELGKICDEHKDEIGDLVKFYRKIKGGIKTLVPHPNVPNSCVIPSKHAAIKETSVEDSPKIEVTNSLERPKIKRSTATSNKENQEKVAAIRPSPVSPLLMQNNPFMYQCTVKGCDFKNRRNRLRQHYINAHEMTEEQADQNVPQKLTMANLKKIECSLCKKGCIPAMLRRHLYHSHNDLSREEANQIFEKAVRKHSKMSPVDDQTDINLESNPLYSKVEPDGRIKCKAPDCEMMVSAQNIARHWHQYHPKLKKDDYQPSLQKLLKILRESSDVPIPTSPAIAEVKDDKSPTKPLVPKKSLTPNEKRRSCGQSGCDYRTSSMVKMAEHRKSLGHNTSSISSPRKSSGSANNTLKLMCGYKDCDFITKYMSNLSRHRKRRNHYLTDDDKREAEAEEKRDEIAKKIEQSHCDSLSEDAATDDEVDVTIPLTKNLSPSKITDYFKPIAKKVKPMQSLDCVSDNKNDATAAGEAEQDKDKQAAPIVPKENHKAKPVLEQ